MSTPETNAAAAVFTPDVKILTPQPYSDRELAHPAHGMSLER